MKCIKFWIFFVMSVGAIAGGDINPYYEPYINSGSENCSSGCEKDGVYIDKDAGLMWQDTMYDDNSDGAYKENRSACKSGNLSFAKNYCQSSSVGGYNDWRLPTSDEMMDISKKNGVFKDNRGADFWTSTPAEHDKYYAVYTVDGYRYARDTKQSNYIRCVRCLTK
jgi:hypothetical protein